MGRFVAEADRGQWTLLPECLDDFIDDIRPHPDSRRVSSKAPDVIDCRPFRLLDLPLMQINPRGLFSGVGGNFC